MKFHRIFHVRAILAVLLLPACFEGLAAEGNFAAYNDHSPGGGTAPNVNTYSLGQGGQTAGGPLIDFSSGAPDSPNQVSVSITGAGDIVGTEGTSGSPDAGTPADQIFGGKIDWLSSAIYFSPAPYDSAVIFTFSNLNPGMKYRFRGTAVRGNNYDGRWTLATLTGASSASPAHITGVGSPGIITNGWAPYGDSFAAETQAAWNSGHNLSGDVIGWDNIIPEGNSFSVICSNYHAVSLESPLGPLEDRYCYAFAAFMLEESPSGPTVALTSPAPDAHFTAPTDIALVAVPANFSNAIQMVEFFADTAKIGEAPASPYEYTWPNAGAGDYALSAVATDSLGIMATSAIVNVTVTEPDTTPPTVSITEPANGAAFNTGTEITITADANDTGSGVSTVEFFQGTSSLGEATATPFSLLWSGTQPGSYTFTAVAIDNVGLRATSAPVMVTLTGPAISAGGLAFDGQNDYVTFGEAPGLGVQAFTIETWFNWRGPGTGATVTTGAGGVQEAIPLVAKGRGEEDGTIRDMNFILAINAADNRLAADFEEGATGPSPGLNHPVYGNTPVTPDVWNHAAVTFDGTNWQLFLNGVLETNTFVGQPPRWDSIQYASLASALDSSGSPVGYFAGVLDEVRIWNYARSAEQIADNRALEIAFAPGLIGRWSLNETTGTTAEDTAGGSIDGTLHNGPVWTNGYPFSSAPSVTITNPVNNDVFVTPTNVTIMASAMDGDGSVTNVQFLEGNAVLGDDADEPFSFTWNNVAPGRYVLRAAATDNSGLSSTSAPVNITVENAIVRLTEPSNDTQFVAPENITLTAEASDTDGAITLVEFFEGATKIGEANSRPFSIVWSNVPAGSYSITAVATDIHDTANTSAPVNITVVPNTPPTVAITSPPNFATIYYPSNLPIVVAATDSDGSVTNVDFYGDGTKLGQRPGTPSPSTLTWTNIPLGVHALAAVATDNKGISATSTVVNITVEINEPPTVQSVNPSAGNLGSLTSIQVAFSEPVTGVDAADLLVNGVPATQLIGAGTLYVFSFPQPDYGPVAITWVSDPGIMDTGVPTLAFDPTGAGATWNYNLIDSTPPTLMAISPSAGSSLTNLTAVQVTFSEPVMGVNASDLLVNGNPAIGLGGSDANYTFSFPQPLYGNVNFTWASGHGIADSSSNPFDGNAPGATWQYYLEAPRTVLVATNATYRLFEGLSEASDPMDAWRAPDFNDSSWTEAPGPFYYDSSGTYYGNTLLANMPGQYLTIYLRYPFVVNNPEILTNLVFVSRSDDGFVAWLNGQEIFHSPTVPYEEIPYTYPNSIYVTSANEPLPFITNTIAVPSTVLVPGTNWLTIHACNTSLSSSDFMIDCQLYVTALDPSVSPPVISSVSPPAGDVFNLNSITVRFSEAVANVNAADLLINGVAATDLTGAGDTWTFDFPQPDYGPVSVTWDANQGIMDLDDPPKPFDGTAPGATFQYSLLNPNAPTVLGQNPLAGATINNLTQVQVTFSKAVQGVDAADLLVNGVAATSVTGTGGARTFTLAQPAYGLVTVTWAANHNITDTESPTNPFDASRPGATWQYTLIDQTPPTIVSQTPAAGTSVTNLTELSVTFSESVMGVNASDLRINGSPATGVDGSGAQYTFTFPQPNATIVNITWAPAHGITDLAEVPNLFDGTAPGSTWVYYTPDNVAPTAASIDPPPGATIRSLSQISVLFTESVSGVDASDLLINDEPAPSVVGNGAGPYVFQFAPPPTGEVHVAWASAHGIRDSAQPPNPFTGGAWGYNFNPNARFEGSVVFNEIMYSPYSTEDADEWIELYNTTADTINLSGWRFSRGVTFTFPNVSVPPHGYLVVCASLAAFQAKHPSVANVVGDWVGRLSNIDESLELKDANGNVVSQIHYADEGDWATRVSGDGLMTVHQLTSSGTTARATALGIYQNGDQMTISGADQPEYNGTYSISGVSWNGRAPVTSFTYNMPSPASSPATGYIVCRQETDLGVRGWSWASLADGFGRSIELCNPELVTGNGQNWQPSLTPEGTPGQPNTVLTNDVAPIISDVLHSPSVPKPADTVFVTAHVLDEDSIGLTVDLFYRNASTTSPGAFTRVDMFDDGLHGDGQAKDGLYRSSVPAQGNATIIEFYVRATDVNNNVRTWPAPALMADGSWTQEANALYQVDDDLAPASPANATQPFYRIIMTETERRRFDNINRESDACMNATWVTYDVDGYQVRYNADVRIRGAGSRGRPVPNNRVNIPSDRRWKGQREINLNTQYIHAQLAGSSLSAKAGMPAARGRVVQVRFNGSNRASSLPAGQSGSGDGFGSYYHFEAFNGDWAQNLFPLNSGGNIYRGSKYPWNANLDYLLGSTPRHQHRPRFCQLRQPRLQQSLQPRGERLDRSVPPHLGADDDSQ